MPPQIENQFNVPNIEPKRKFPRWTQYVLSILVILIAVTVVKFVFTPIGPMSDEAWKNIAEYRIAELKFISTSTSLTTSTSTVSWNTENMGDFSGYYVKRENVYGEENTGPFVCDSFVVLNGNEPLIKYYKDMVEKGNTVNALDENGSLRINLDLNGISDVNRSKIINSSKNNPIILALKKKIEPGKGAPACHSFFEILEVK